MNKVAKKRMVLLAAVAVLLPGLAFANGAAIDPGRLPEASRKALQKQIQDYRKTHSVAFDAVAGVRGCSEAGYRDARVAKPLCGRELRALGRDVLLPLIEALAFQAPVPGAGKPGPYSVPARGVPSTAVQLAEKEAFVSGLIEAIGVIRDARSLPVLRAVLELPGTPVARQSLAAEAIGRLNSVVALQILVPHTKAGGPLQTAAIDGLGHCKRVDSAQHLAAMLGKQPDAATAATLAKALGSVASSWAWQAMARQDAANSAATTATGLQVRTVAAQALVRAFAAYDGAVREAAGEALQMAEHPDTVALLAQARRNAPAAAVAAIDAYSLEFARRHSR